MITGIMRKLVEWIMYSLDIEMAQQLPIAVSLINHTFNDNDNDNDNDNNTNFIHLIQ